MPLGVEVGLGPSHIVLGGTQLLHGQGHSSPHTFRPTSIMAKRLDGSGYHLVQW